MQSLIDIYTFKTPFTLARTPLLLAVTCAVNSSCVMLH